MKKGKHYIVLVSLLFFVPGVYFFYKSSRGPDRTILLRFGHDMPEDSTQHSGAMNFKKIVEDKTEGRIKIEIYPNQVLGTDPEMVEMVQKGTLAFSLPPTSKIVRLAPRLEILDLPYLFSDRMKMYEALDGPFGESLTHRLRETGIEPVMIWDAGFKNFTADKKISSPEDIGGLRFRVMPSPTLENQILSLNAFPVKSDFHQIRASIIEGFIDCQENPISSVYGMKINDVHSYMTLSQHGFLGQIFVVSKKILDQLSPEDRKLILEAAKSSGDFQRKQLESQEKKFLMTMKESGLKITELSEDEKKEFISKFAPLYYEKRSELKKFKAYINPEILKYLKVHAAVGLNLSFNFQASASAIAIKRGAELAIDEINAQGGLLGRDLILMTRNHSGFPRNGVRNLQNLSQDESIVAVIGGMHSPVVLAERETINKLKIPYLIPWAAATPIISETNPYIFRFSVRDEDAGPVLVKKASQLGTKVALLLENTGWGKSNLRSIEKSVLKTPDIEIGSVHWFDWGRNDFVDILNEIYSTNDDAIIFVGNSPEGTHLLKGMAKFERRIPIISHWGITGGRFWEESQAVLKTIDLRFLHTFNLLESEPGSKAEALLKRYMSKYQLKENDYIPATFGTVHSYELVKLLSKAISDSESFEKEDIAGALVKMKSYEGLFRSFKNPFGRKGRMREALTPSDISFGKYNETGNIVNDQR